MLRLLFFTSFTMLFGILILGDYNMVTFIFIVSVIILPFVIFKYKKYPERSIYAFLIIWVTVPKYVSTIPLIGSYVLPGFSYFDIFQTIAICHIISLLFLKGYKNISALKMPKDLQKMTIFFSIIIFFTTIVGVIRYFLVVPQSEQFAIGNFLELVFTPFSGLIFFLGLFAFIIQYKQVEKLLFIIAFGGFLLLIEQLVMVELNLFSALNILAYAEDGFRFNSLIYGSYDIKGIFCVISALAILYLSISKQKYYLIPFVFLMIFPISLTYQRTPYLGYFFGLLIFATFYFKKLKLSSKLIIFLTFTIIILFSIVNQKSSYNYLNNFLNGDKEGSRELNQSQSFYDRLGLWYRAVDVFIYSFPIGVGEGMYEVYSGRRFAPTYVAPLVNLKSRSAYLSLIGNHRTKPHNVYIQFISEYNVLGFIVLYFFIRKITIYLSFKRYKKIKYKNDLFRATVAGMVVSVGVMSSFDSVIRLYFLYGLLMFLAYFISKLENYKVINKK